MIRRLTAVLLAAAFAAPALATDALSSSYWDAAYLNSSREDEAGNELELEGFRLAASVGLASFLNFTGDYEQRRYHSDRIGTGSAGFAWHTQDPVWRFHLGATYERFEFDDNANPAADAIEDGYGVEAGFRYALPHVELHAAYRYMDFGQLDRTEADFTAQRYGAGVAVQLSPWWSLVADYRVREHKLEDTGLSSTTDYNEYTVGFRRYFATDTDRRVRRDGVLAAWFGGEDEAETVE
jgi:opacity protein-like surface antigen